MNCQHLQATYTGRRSNGERACYLYIYECPECGIMFGSPAKPNDKGLFPGHPPPCEHKSEYLKPIRKEERTCCGGKKRMVDIWECSNCGAEFSL